MEQHSGPSGPSTVIPIRLRPEACVAGDCVWLRWARECKGDAGTARARLLRAYLLDLQGLCRCPRRRFSRRV